MDSFCRRFAASVNNLVGGGGGESIYDFSFEDIALHAPCNYVPVLDASLNYGMLRSITRFLL